MIKGFDENIGEIFFDIEKESRVLVDVWRLGCRLTNSHGNAPEILKGDDFERRIVGELNACSFRRVHG